MRKGVAAPKNPVGIELRSAEAVFGRPDSKVLRCRLPRSCHEDPCQRRHGGLRGQFPAGRRPQRPTIGAADAAELVVLNQ